MGVLDFLATTPNSTGFSLTNPTAWDWLLGGRKSTSGVMVNRDTSLGYPAVWRAVNLISRDVAKLPLVTYERMDDDGKRKATEHPAYKLLKVRPNSEMTAFTFKMTLTAHALLNRGGYAWIERNGAGDPIELIPLDPDATYPIRVNGQMIFVTTDTDGRMRRLLPENVLHIKGLGFDGLCGYSITEKLNESLGLGLALQRYGSVFFKNNGRPGTIIELPNHLKDAEAINRFKRAWADSMEGVDNAHKVKLLEDGAKVSAVQVKNEEAQFLQSREFEIRQIANIFGCPPHKLGDSSRVAYNSLEQENQSYLDDCLDPWLVNWEEECETKLLRTREVDTETHICEFLRQALVRADMTARFSAYQVGVASKILFPNEARIRENLNPYPGGWEFAEEPEPQPATEPQQSGPDDETAQAIESLRQVVFENRDWMKQALLAQAHMVAEVTNEQRAATAAIEAAVQRARAIEQQEREDAADMRALEDLRARKNTLSSRVSEPDEREQRIRQTHRTLISDAVWRTLRRVSAQAQKASKRATGYHDWLDGLRTEHAPTLLEAMESPLVAIEAYWGVEPNRDELSASCFDSLHERLLAAGDGDPDGFCERVEQACRLAEQEIPGALADALILERKTYELTETAA